MRKILPLLVVGIFVCSGLGAVAIPFENKSNARVLQPQLEATAICGWGILVTIKNVGTETFQGDITCRLDIDVPSFITISGHKWEYNGWTLEPGASILVRGRVFGFGPATISMDLDYGQGVITGNTTGYMILFFIIGAAPIVIP